MKPPTTFRGQLITFIGIAIVGWVAYLLIFQQFFPNTYNPNDSRSILWVWLTVGTFLTCLTVIAAFRLCATPPPWQSSMAIAGIAPALILDSFATTFFSEWFDSAGPHQATAYSATVLAGAGSAFLLALILQWRATKRR